MRHSWKASALLAVLLASLAAPSAYAVNCTGVPAWNASTIYNPGARVVFNNNLYQAVIQIWNTPPDYCPSCNWWTLVGACDGSGGNQPPTVSLTAPANGATFTAGANLTLSASASDTDGSIAKVEFFQGSTSLGVDTTTPYSVVFSNVAAGSYTVKAVATDNGGAMTTSATVSITVNPAGNRPPSVSLTSPANGAVFAPGINIQLSADASDSDGTITKVEFFDGSTKIGEDTTTPYGVTLTNAAAGSHTLTARATDNGGAMTTSAAVTVTVGNNPPPSGHLLIGYWHGSFTNGAGVIKLRDVSPDWDVIDVAFAEPVAGSSSNIQFTPDPGVETPDELKSDIALLKSRGKKVLISIGGANGHVQLNTDAQRQEFVNSMKSIISTYGFSGMDIDFEGQSVSLNLGDADVKNPTTPLIKNLISAIRSVHDAFGSSFVLSMAPETFFVQVGFQFYGGVSAGADRRAGAYLPVIHALRDILTFLHVQDYNSGPVTALDNVFYTMPSPDFHVAMTEMVMTGFPVAGNPNNFFPGLRPDQVAIGLPATNEAGNGFTPAADVQKAVNYLTKGISFGGSYKLKNPAGYPAFKGLMTWSINWDKFGGFSFSKPHRQFLNSLP
jgi:chitinase